MDHAKIPELRNLTSPLLQFFVVMPDGHIKRCLFERNLDCPLLTVEWQRDASGRKVALLSVDVKPSLRRQGWIGLEDLYIAEDRAEDFTSYVQWSDHANDVPGADALGEEYLPDEVLRRRRDFKKEQRKIVLRPAKGSKKSTKDGGK